MLSRRSRLVDALLGRNWQDQQNQMAARIDQIRFLAGQGLAMQVGQVEAPRRLSDVEFSVFSQFGDDGIIQWLIRQIPEINRSFVEFGVGDYSESNTRFLLLNNRWRGLVMDGSATLPKTVRSSPELWSSDLTPVSAFVSAENINGLLLDHGFAGDLGLLHIDIDGNDYWVWKAITVARPVIVIVEYNSVFGSERAITIPYEPLYTRVWPPDPRALMTGVSLPALCDLAEQKGYDFIGSNGAGNNAYFVLQGAAPGLKALTAQQGYVESTFAESRGSDGQPLRGAARAEAIRGLSVFNTRTGMVEPF